MGFFDGRILAALKDGKTKSFMSLLGEVGFSHNTPQRHLDRLISRGLVVKEKVASKPLGRPKFACHILSTAAKHVLLEKRFGRTRLYGINEQSFKAGAFLNLLRAW
jgi:predicted ArsR family transcriptional regulator